MTATAHAIVGGAIASSVQNPTLGLTLAFLSHPLLDFIPHWDVALGWRSKPKDRLVIESLSDLAIGLILTIVLFQGYASPLYLIASVLLAISWDFAGAPYIFLNWKFPPFTWIYLIQSKWQGRAKLPWGLITQIVTILIAIAAVTMSR